jgi:hypothetical protein
VNLSVNGSVGVVHNNPWGQTEVVVSLPLGGETSVALFGKVRLEDVQQADGQPRGISWRIDEAQADWLTIKLSARGAYTAETSLTLLDIASWEKVRIMISPTGEVAARPKGEDPIGTWLFHRCIVFAIVSAVYIACKLGAVDLLPPGGPFRDRR